MTIDSIDHIAVLGAGSMGHGIAEVAAIAGYSVTLRDIDEELVQDGYERIEWSLEKLRERGELNETEVKNSLARIATSTSVAETVAETDFVIEAVPERQSIKREVFEEVSDHAPEDALFASNTSSLSITELAEATDRPGQFCGMHFFNPPVRMQLVEVIAGDATAETTLARTEALAESMGKTPIRVRVDRPGFIVNRLLIPLINEAAWMVHREEASIEEIDASVKYELGTPMGPFELADQVGIDVIGDILEYIHEELGSAYEPCPLLLEQIEREELGRKTERGFYEYADSEPSIPSEAASEETSERMLAVLANELGKLLEEGVAPLEEIDRAMQLGAGFPDGPGVLADEVGVESLQERLLDRYEATGHDRYQVSSVLDERANRGSFYEPAGQADDTFETLAFDQPVDHVAEIRLDREHRMHAITPQLLEELPKAIERAEADDAVRAIVLSASGTRAFSVGADLNALSGMLEDTVAARQLSRQGQAAFGRLGESPLPVVVAIEGYCLGGGMELATAGDLRVASEGATFGQPERDLGLVPGWGATQRLAPIIGLGRAKEVILTGDRYDAETMHSYGFLNRIVEPGSAREQAQALAQELASGPPIAQGFAKQAITASTGDEEAGLAFEASSFGQLVGTDDLKEGVAAFLEDREATFEGR